MTDVWKSNARKFCELCKVWFADNRVSIEHHEGGQKHKAAIQAKLRELGKQSKQKEKEQTDLERTLAMMESAASKSMGADDTACPSAGMVGPMLKPKRYMDLRAHSASVAEMARQMAERRKEQELERKKSSLEKEGLKYEQPECEEETVWVEAKADNGAPYYFHMYTGVTVWEKPKNFFTAEQYAMKLATADNSSDGGGGAMTGNQITEPERFKSEPRRHWGQHETPESDAKTEKAPRRRRPAEDSVGKTAPEEANLKILSNIQLPCTSATSQAMKKEPEILPSEETVVKFEYPPSDATEQCCDIPLPPSPQRSGQQKRQAADSVAVKEEPAVWSGDDQIVQPDTSTGQADSPEESVPEIKTEPVNGIAEEMQQQQPEPPRASPYGPWVPVKKRPEKLKINWELPTEEEGRKRVSEPVLAPEDVVPFGDKSAAVKKRKVDGPIEFRKRKAMVKTRRPVNE